MDPSIIISEINDYSAKTGLKVTTICQRAFGNARYLDRLHARLDRLGDEIQRFRDFAAENPPAHSGFSTPTSESQHDPASSDPA